MNRKEALELVNAMVSNKNLRKHMLATEACMKALAKHFQEDVEKWALCGLLHDLDYDETFNSPNLHGLRTVEILENKGLEREILDGIKAHCGHKTPGNKMEKALYAVDHLTGLIVAAALMHPEKRLNSLDVEFVLRRFKEKKFAAGANREQIKSCEELGLSLEEFIGLCLKAMQEISSDLEL